MQIFHLKYLLLLKAVSLRNIYGEAFSYLSKT